LAAGTVVLLFQSAINAAEPRVAQDRFPSGRECAAMMTVPPGFEVKLFAGEPDVVNPIGIDFDHRGRVYVLECLQYPQKAPPGSKGRDRIRIFEDTKGDGHADKVTTFADGLNLATGIAVGHGGVFVGEAPNLVFLESTKGDDKADKRTVLLDGWGYQDTHETLNSFIWGPDGWLYGCHGVFTHSRIGKPGTPDKERVPLNAGIWRYKLPHPFPSPLEGEGSRVRGKFEVFAEGTSNPWGFDYDENGSGFLTACVIPHLFHMVPGGLYVRQAGQNFNPYAFGQIREICDHVHYFGVTPHSGNKDPRSLNKGGGHAHAGCLIYQGGAYPEEWNGRIFMNNIHGSRINTDILKRNGSTYVGSHGPDFLVANDPNFRAIQLRTGPDGSIYIIDWYDPQICHNPNPDIWDRTHGRIYKVVYKGTPQPKVGDLSKRSSEELVELLKDKNSWWWRQSLLILGERQDKSVGPKLKELVRQSDDYHHSLRALWALYDVGAFDEEFGRETLDHTNPWLRAWAARLLAQLDHKLSAESWKKLIQLAKTDPSPDVRLQLASASQRWRKHDDPTELLQALMQRSEDATDPAIPLLIWLAYEPGLLANYQRSLDWLLKHADNDPLVRDQIVPRALRRLVATNDPKHLDAAVSFAGNVFSSRAMAAALDGLLEALKGQRVPKPASWHPVTRLDRDSLDADPLSRRLVRLGAHFSDPNAAAFFEQSAADPRQETRQRIEAVQALALARQSSSVDVLLRLAVSETSRQLKQEVFRALAGFDSEKIPATLLAEWPKLPPELRTEVIGLLSGRRIWAAALLDGMQKKTLSRQDVTENDVRRIMAFKDAALAKKLEQVWGKLREQTPQKVEEQLVKFRKQLAELPADRKAGQAVFEKNCMVCHKLRGQGHEVGPDLTGANRRDMEYLLVNILDPNRVVGKDYYSAFVADKSGRIHTGLLAEDTPQRIVLKGENAKLTVIPRSDIEEFKIEEKSLMPEGLPEKMTEREFRDLIAYLLEDPYLTRGLITGPFKMALDSSHPIETAVDPLKLDGIKWKPFEVGPTGFLDMDKLKVLAPPTDSTAYLHIEVRAPRALQTTLELAADDDVKVWLNGKEVFRRMQAMQAQRVPLELREGANRLLFKVHNVYGGSFLWARLSDPERQLEGP
jgi:putative membrane-bound dehydrogenase-like protein